MMRKIQDEIPYFKLKMALIILLAVTSLFLGIVYFILIHFAVENVTVEGNKHYSALEIKQMIMNSGPYCDNSIYLSLKYKNKGVEGVPFIETMNVQVLDKNSIKITVYEKALAGYVEYLGRYMYFDKDGIVVEASKVPTAGIPQVTGLKFDHVILYDKLPIENGEVFQNILTITQLLNKYNVIADKIYFDENNLVTLSYGQVKVALGEMKNLDDKMMQLPFVLPDLEGKSGTLDMQNYTVDTKSITFQAN